MPSAELQAVLDLIRKNPFSTSAGEAELRTGMDRFADSFGVPDGIASATIRLGGVRAERQVADAGGPRLLYLHGGGYVMGSPASHRHVTGRLAAEMGGTVYSLDYRLAPEAPFPAAVDDALAAYRDLLAEAPAARIAIAGDSAGGGLTFATALAARAEGLPMPGCLVGISPWVELGTRNESYEKLAGADPMLSRAIADFFAVRYLAGADRETPLASPLHADLAGLPPVLIQIGDRECFFGDAASMHQNLIAAGVDTQLAVWKEMFHVWHLYWPMLEEGRRAIAEAGSFIKTHCGS